MDVLIFSVSDPDITEAGLCVLGFGCRVWVKVLSFADGAERFY